MTSENSSSQPDNGPLSPAGVRALKIAIAVMTFLIVAGIVTIIGRIIYLASKPATQARDIIDPATAPARARLALPPGARIENMTLSGSRLAVHHTGQAGDGIVIFDLQSGKTVTRLEIVPQLPD